MGAIGEELYDRVETALRHGDVAAAHDHAAAGLAERPDDAQLLRLAARAEVELGSGKAVGHLRKLVEVLPDDAGAWRELGLALLDDGEVAEASNALRTAVELKPDDEAALVCLAHLAYVTGEADEATRLLTQALEQHPGDVGVLRNLVDMYRSTGQMAAAVERAEQLLAQTPKDVLALLDVADLHLELGNYDNAAWAFAQLRDVDTVPGHGPFAYHGMLEAEARRGRWRQALDVAIEATSVDRHQLTTDLLAFVTAKLFGEAGRPAPPWRVLEARLAAERAEHRRAHLEELVAEEGR